MSIYNKKSIVPILPQREFLRPHEVARKLGISREAVMRHLRSKRLPGLKLGNMWLIRSSELERCLSLRETLFDTNE